MANIRKAVKADCTRIAEIEVFNYRLNFYPIFLNDEFYFDELCVTEKAESCSSNSEFIDNTYVYDDGVVKGFIAIEGQEVVKLFVEPVLQRQGIGARLLEYAVSEYGVDCLWALEKNTRAIAFYERHGFHLTDSRKYEEGTTEYLVRMKRESE